LYSKTIDIGVEIIQLKNINITFVDYFLEICKNDNDFIIEYKKLQEYKVINNIDTSYNIEKMLKTV